MKAKQLFYLLLALPLLAVACNEEPEVKPTPAPAEAELNITSATSVDFTADGGNGEITYELKNAVEGIKLTAEADAAWITDVTVADKVTYFVEANETEEAREATITLTYGALTKSVAVKQAAKANEKPEPELEASIWSLVGTHNGWKPASGTTMYIVEGYFVAYGFELTTASEFKFVKDGAWGGDLGGEGIPAEANCYYKTGSANIKVVADGKYDIYLNEATDTFYVMEEGKLPEQATEPTKPVVDKWELVGDFEGSNWTGAEFAKDGDRFVLQDVKFANANNEGCAFKVRNNGAWYGTQSAEALEINTAIALDGDKNIVVNAEVGVAYDFYFDATTMKVWVMEDGKTPEDAPQPEPAYDFEFKAGAINGTYYGDEYSLVGDTYNYLIILSENGVAHENDTTATQYRFDFHSGTPCNTEPATLPLGVYTIDVEETTEANTCGSYYSGNIVAENGLMTAMNWYESGTITVTENRIEAVIVDTNGKTHHVVYEGPLQFGFEQVELGNVEFNYDAEIIVAENYGDVYGVGCDWWYIYAYEQYDEETYEPFGHHFGIELFIDPAAENLTGVYTLAEDEMEDYSGTFLAGYDEGDYLYGYWYIDYDNYVGVPMVDGTITVELGEDNKYTFTFDCIDNGGNTITGTAAGFVDVLDMREEGASLSSAKLSPKRVLSTKKAALR